jgi:hypothetical protein
MLEIEFEPVFSFAKEFPPVLAKKMLPDWIKNLQPVLQDGTLTAKKCPPMIDFLTSGYYIRSVGDYQFKRWVVNGEENIEVSGDLSIKFFEEEKEITIPTIGFHTFEQAPITNNDIRKQIWKFYEFWTVRTPPGYSTMFISPLQFYQPFSIFPSVVDTDDNFGVPQSFPAMSTYNDTETYEWQVKKGDPIVMAFPFKRDSWSSKIVDINLANRPIAMDKSQQSYVADFHKKKNWG